MSKRTCSIKGCGKPVVGRGWCNRHWKIWREHGTPYGPQVVLIPDLPGERWLPVAGYEGLYEVSDMGRVRSLDRLVPNGSGFQSVYGRLLKQSLHVSGHLQVTLYRNGNGWTVQVHRLVREAFLSPLPGGMETLHGPGGKRDNRVVNLSFGTKVENAADRLRDGTHREGTALSWAKLTDEIVRDCRVRYVAGGVSGAALAAEFGVTFQTMHKALSRKTWKHIA